MSQEQNKVVYISILVYSPTKIAEAENRSIPNLGEQVSLPMPSFGIIQCNSQEALKHIMSATISLHSSKAPSPGILMECFLNCGTTPKIP